MVFKSFLQQICSNHHLFTKQLPHEHFRINSNAGYTNRGSYITNYPEVLKNIRSLLLHGKRNYKSHYLKNCAPMSNFRIHLGHVPILKKVKDYANLAVKHEPAHDTDTVQQRCGKHTVQRFNLDNRHFLSIWRMGIETFNIDQRSNKS